jgi:hypothetical protein
LESNFAKLAEVADYAEAPRQRDAPSTRDEPMSEKEVRQAKLLLAKGQYRKAAQLVRGRQGVAKITPEVTQTIVDMFVQGEPNPFGDRVGRKPRKLKDLDILEKVVQQLDPQTAGGISGWNAELVQMGYGTPEKHPSFRRFIATYSQLIWFGVAPGRKWMTVAAITPLLKPTDPDIQPPKPEKLRPTTCGEVLIGIAMRWVYTEFGIPDGAMLPEQFGMFAPGGVEPILEQIDQEIDSLERRGKEDRTLYDLDCEGAYQNAPLVTLAEEVLESAPEYFRVFKWVYNHTSLMVVGNNLEDLVTIDSSDGVRQGCPLAGFGYNLVMKQTIKALKEEVLTDSTDVVMALHDDLKVISSDCNLWGSISKFFAQPADGSRRRDGIILNLNKCKTSSLREASSKYGGIRVLGSIKGTVGARREFIEDKIEYVRTTITRLVALPHQLALLLLRNCISKELGYLLRTVRLEGMEQLLEEMDENLLKEIDRLRAAPEGEQRSAKSETIVGLPDRMGGMGIYLHAKIYPAATQAAREAARNQLALRKIPAPRTIAELAALAERNGVMDYYNVYLAAGDDLPTAPEEDGEQVRTQKALTQKIHDRSLANLMEELNVADRTSFVDNGSKIGSAWMSTAPVGKYRHLTDQQTSAGIAIRLLVPSGNNDEHCVSCGGPNPPQHHEGCNLIGTEAANNYRHTYVNNRLAEVVKTSADTAITVTTEPHLPNSNLLADIKICPAAGAPGNNETVFADLTVKVVQAGNTIAAREAARLQPGQENDPIRTRVWREINAALEVGVKRKNQHYHDQHVRVVPLVISSGGTLEPRFVNFLKEWVTDPKALRKFIVDVSIVLVLTRAFSYTAGILKKHCDLKPSLFTKHLHTVHSL